MNGETIRHLFLNRILPADGSYAIHVRILDKKLGEKTMVRLLAIDDDDDATGGGAVLVLHSRKHWICLLRPKDQRTVIFIDSLSKPPAYWQLTALKKSIEETTYDLQWLTLFDSQQQIQSDETELCGVYVLAIVAMILELLPFSTIETIVAEIRSFFKNTDQKMNDEKLVEYFQRLII